MFSLYHPCSEQTRIAQHRERVMPPWLLVQRTIIRVPCNGGNPGLLTTFGSAFLLGEDFRRVVVRRLAPHDRLSVEQPYSLTRSRHRIYRVIPSLGIFYTSKVHLSTASTIISLEIFPLLSTYGNTVEQHDRLHVRFRIVSLIFNFHDEFHGEVAHGRWYR